MTNQQMPEVAPEKQASSVAEYASQNRRRGRLAKIALLVILVLALLAAVWLAMYYMANRRMPFPALDTTGQTDVAAPQFLYAISGPEGANMLEQPVGVAVSPEGRVFVVDGKNRVVRAYTSEGDYLFSFNKVESEKGTELGLPARVTIGPDGNVWVTDRRLRSIFVFSPEDGSFVKEFVPEGDITETWGPLALSFDAQDNLYVADVGLSKEHRVVAFDPQGKEIARWGTTAKTANIEDSPGGFHYPNGIAFSKEDEVFVSDMSNRRVQVFDPQGVFKRILATSGSPLGIVIDPQQRLYVVDPFAHSIDIYKLDGTQIVAFGGPGIELGRFRFPSDIALDETGRIFVSDRENNRVQVWGWPSGIIPPVTVPTEPFQWALCLAPLLLLLIPLLLRRRAFLVTEDFLKAMIDAEKVKEMDQRRLKWIVTEELYEAYRNHMVENVAFKHLLHHAPYSHSDVQALMERAGVDEQTAIHLTMAERVGRLATEDRALTEDARAMRIEVIDHVRFLEDYARKTSGKPDKPAA